jgi:hypothetical protein
MKITGFIFGNRNMSVTGTIGPEQAQDITSL